MTIRVSAFQWVPEFAQGYVRDLRVRWALEEAGLPYEAILIDRERADSAEYRLWQPFSQVPAYQDDEVTLFESGAIVLHVAAKSDALAPLDPAGRARVSTWVFAALNSVEPFVQNLNQIDEQADAPWAASRREEVESVLGKRLDSVAQWLGDEDYLEGRFTAGDLMMTTVLRELVDSGVLSRYPSLDAYRERCVARLAFQRAMDAQLRPFAEHASA